LRMAEDLATRGPRRLSIVFVAYDAEELGLFGGYDYLRKHVVIGNEPMLAFMNFEIPSNAHDGATATAKTSGPIAKVIEETEVPVLYALNAGLDAVAPLFGGLIPTDIQGMYWYGLQGLSTACESPYYHTTADTPDKLDTGFLAQVTIAFEGLVAAVDSQPLASFAVRDPKLWRAAVRMEPDAASGGLGVEVAVADDGGAPQAGARVAVWLDVDDFSRAHRVSVTADSDGRARVVIPSGALAVGEGGRFVHVTAGRAFPLVEWIGAVR
jgi:hypothetical protein